MFILWQIKLVPRDNIYFDVYPGFLWHGAFFNFVARHDRSLASLLHDESARAREFKLSFPLPKDNVYKKEELIKLNIGSSNDDLNSLLRNLADSGTEKTFNLKNISLSLSSIKLMKRMTFEDVNKAVLPRHFTILFVSPTCFRSSGRHILFPDPKVLFTSLAIKWNSLFTSQVDISDQELENILISSYRLRTSVLKCEGFSLIGFVGEVKYSAKSLNLASRKKLGKLLILADFLGIGYRTTMGLGNCKIKIDKKIDY